MAGFANGAFSLKSADPVTFGTASLFTTPVYNTGIIAVNTFLNSVSSSMKGGDVSAVIADNVRMGALNLWKQAGLSAGVESLPPQDSRRATCVIATDPKIGAVLAESMPSGNSNFDYQIAESPNGKMDDKLFLFFRFDNPQTPHPLNTFVIQTAPSLVFNNNRSIGSSHVKQLAVFPRVDVVSTSSTMAGYTVTGIDASFASRTPLPV